MKHDIVEKNIGIMLVLIVFAISFGGLVEIIPVIDRVGRSERLPG